MAWAPMKLPTRALVALPTNVRLLSTLGEVREIVIQVGSEVMVAWGARVVHFMLWISGVGCLEETSWLHIGRMS